MTADSRYRIASRVWRNVGGGLESFARRNGAPLRHARPSANYPCPLFAAGWSRRIPHRFSPVDLPDRSELVNNNLRPCLPDRIFFIAEGSSASATIASAPILCKRLNLAGERVKPATLCPAAISKGARRRPRAPVAPATRTLIEVKQPRQN